MRNEKPVWNKGSNQGRPIQVLFFFASKAGFHEGTLKNYSQNGLFISSRESLPVGEVLTIALPYLDDNTEKRTGQIMWRCKEGFGVELFRVRRPTY